MQTQEMFTILKERFSDSIVEENTTNRDPFLQVKPESILPICRFVRQDPRFKMDYLASISGVDYGKTLGIVYHLESIQQRHLLVLKADLPRENPRVDSVSSLWSGANWHEREAFDLVGIDFAGHPNLKRILCAEDWVGHPLRKDYEYPTEFHGIPCPLTVHTLPEKERQRAPAH
jgi:NADH-quinone oxidoreductase subunit C